MSRVKTLKAVTQRLNQTPVAELPHIAYFLSSSISSCADVLNTGRLKSGGKHDGAAFQVQKLKARITSLLQDRSPEGRFTAVVLAKAVVEAGSQETLASCEPWLRGLLAALNKSDPPSSTRLYLLTITRIFSLTWQYPSLIREITTPLLPAFVTTCIRVGNLQLLEDGEGLPTRPSPNLETSLQCMLHLIPHHPSTFRPFASKLYTALVKLISCQACTHRVARAARSLFVALHFCSPKNSVAEEWSKACKGTIASAHNVTDQIFRPIVENWQPSCGSRPQSAVDGGLSNVPQVQGDPIASSWVGLHQGSKGLVSLLNLLETFILESTSQSVDLPVGFILNLTSRLLHVRELPAGAQSRISVELNPEVARNEYEDMSMALPVIHQVTLNLLSSLIETAGQGIQPAGREIFDQCLWIIVPQNLHQETRLSLYRVLGKVIPLIGISLTKVDAQQLSTIIEYACTDIDPRSLGHKLVSQNHSRPEIRLGPYEQSDPIPLSAPEKWTLRESPLSTVEFAASLFLTKILEYIPAQSIPHSIRTQIDRTAIAHDEKHIMLASVLNPSPRISGISPTPSIVPFLARTSRDNIVIEGLIRPRVPIIQEVRLSSPGLEIYPADNIDNQQIDGTERTERISQSQEEPPLQQMRDGLGVQGDILDRLEDSLLEDGPGLVSTAEAPSFSITHPTNNFSLRAGGIGPVGHGPLRDGKRKIDTADVSEIARISKRPQVSDLALDFEGYHPVEETSAGAVSMIAPVIADSEPVVSTQVVCSAYSDRDESRESGEFSRSQGRAGFEKEPDGDDGSDSEIPPIHLKTSSDEEEEEKEDDDMV